MMRRFIVGAAAAVFLAGCTAQSAPQQTEPAHAPVLIPSGTVATAELTTVAGDPFGEVTIIRDGEGYRIEYPDLAALTDGGEIAQPELALSDSPFTTDECGDANIWQIGWADDSIRTVPFDADAFPDGDWSFFTSVIVVGFVELGGDGCTQPILATGPLVWDQPVVRPWVDPVDGGERPGAMGATLGTLYSTAEGDIWSEIAARFGISGDDLEWLNPIRVGSQPGTAYAHQQLNLDPADRSDSESRRPTG